ncbi:MAG: helical backbone metal receptor [Candidatus Sericytochromatia bacterium]|nr:helical backbone metal receptor [Candidatus Sericytochromatia bacterium]
MTSGLTPRTWLRAALAGWGLMCLLALPAVAAPTARSGVPASAPGATPVGGARRILSLGPSLTEMVCALGLGDRLVGRTRWCNQPPSVSRLPVVGAVGGWNEERVVSLRPDTILALEGEQGPVQRLARLTGARLIVLPTLQLADVGRNMRAIAEAAGVPERGARWANDLSQGLALRRRRLPAAAGPTTVYLVWDEPLMLAGPHSYIGELIRLAGGTNPVSSRLPGPYPQFSWEGLLLADPEVLLAPEDRRRALRRVATGYPRLRAVQRGRLHTLPDDLISRPGPRVLAALDALTRLLQPVQ